MISAQNALLLHNSIEGAKQRRAADRTSAQQHAQNREIAGSKMKPAPAAKKGGAKKKGGAAKPTSAAVPTSTITPYLNANDLLGVSDAVSTAENTDADARMGFATSAADALLAAGNTERARGKGVAGANEDAAARGLYASGIRERNIGAVNMDAFQRQADLQGGLRIDAANAVTQRLGAKNQLASYLQAAAAKAAENGAALPIDPYQTSSAPGANVPGAATKKKARR